MLSIKLCSNIPYCDLFPVRDNSGKFVVKTNVLALKRLTCSEIHVTSSGFVHSTIMCRVWYQWHTERV